ENLPFASVWPVMFVQIPKMLESETTTLMLVTLSPLQSVTWPVTWNFVAAAAPLMPLDDNHKTQATMPTRLRKEIERVSFSMVVGPTIQPQARRSNHFRRTEAFLGEKMLGQFGVRRLSPLFPPGDLSRGWRVRRPGLFARRVRGFRSTATSR